MEKSMINSKKQPKKLPMIFIIILAILVNIGFLYLMPIKPAIYEYNQHVINNDHYYECYNQKGKELYSDSSSNSNLHLIDGVNVSHCEYIKFDNAFSCGIANIFDGWFVESLCVTSVCLLTISISILIYILLKFKAIKPKSSPVTPKKFLLTFRIIGFSTGILVCVSIIIVRIILNNNITFHRLVNSFSNLLYLSILVLSFIFFEILAGIILLARKNKNPQDNTINDVENIIICTSNSIKVNKANKEKKANKIKAIKNILD